MGEFVHSLQGYLNMDDSLVNPSVEGDNPWPFDYRYALNFIKDNTGRNGQGENVRGTLAIEGVWAYNAGTNAFTDQTVMPAGTNKCIGKYIDRGNLRLIYLIYNSLGSHGIYVYDLKENKIKRYYQSSLLNFSGKYITGLALYGDDFVFTDGENPQRHIDLSRIHKKTYALSDFHISLAKASPLAPPVVTPIIAPAAGGGTEDMKRSAFQFVARYRYKNGMKSPFSAISNMVYSINNDITGIQVHVPGMVYNSVGHSWMAHSQAEVYDEIEYIEICVRNSEAERFRVLKRITMSSIADYAPIFDNGGASAVIPFEETGRTFDSIPFTSGALAGIDNRIMLADNVDDFPDVPNVGIKNIEYYYTYLTDQNWLSPLPIESPAALADVVALNKGNQQTFKLKGKYLMGVVFGDETGRRSLVYQFDKVFHFEAPASFLLMRHQAAVGFEFNDDFLPPEWATWYEIVRTDCLNYEFFINAVCNGVAYMKLKADGTDYESATKADASVVFVDITNWSEPTKKNEAGSEGNPLNNIYYNYQSGDYMSFYGLKETFFIKEVIDGKLVIDNNFGAMWPTEGYVFPIEVFRPRSYSEQDTVLFYSMGEWYPIKSPKTSSRAWTKKNWRYTNNHACTAGAEGSFKWYNNYPIARGDVHKVTRTFYFDYNTNSSASSTTMSVQSMHPGPDRLGDRWEHGSGHSNVAYQDRAQQRRLETQVRFGGRYVAESSVNNLNRFEFDDQKVYPVEFGPIRKLQPASNAVMQNLSNILLAIHETETISIYVNKTTLEDEIGNVQLLKSDDVLGSWNTLAGSHGTLNPESVEQEGNRVYWWSSIKGSWIRYSRDGVTEISKNKMDSFYSGIGAMLLSHYGTSTPPVALSGYDLFNGELIVNHKHSALPAKYPAEDETDPNNGYERYKCCGFLEKPANRWRTFYPYEDAEMFAALGNNFYSFKDGLLYQHHAGDQDSYNTIYGEKTDTIIEIVCNTAPLAVKSFESFAILAMHGWSVTRLLTNLKKKGDNAQQSHIDIAKFTNVEGRYASQIFNDIYTKNMDAAEALHGGDKMRGNYLRALLTLDSTLVNRTALYAVQIGFTESKKNTMSHG